MADSTIAGLPASTTPLAGTELVPIYQSSATKQVSIANLTAGRSVSAASYTVSTGNITQGTAAKGFDFSANTPAAGKTSTLLNWYEQGTWTPVVADASTGGHTASVGTSVGLYTRVGNSVVLHFQVTSINTTGMTSGNFVFIRGLPFTSNSTSGAFGEPDLRYVTFTVKPHLFLDVNSLWITLFEDASAGAGGFVAVSKLTSGSASIQGSITYSV